MNKWDARMLALVDLVASWSKDPSTQVGAAIVDSKNRVVSLGFNGLPRAVRDSDVLERDEKLRRTIHAEENALLFASRSVEGCTIYGRTHLVRGARRRSSRLVFTVLSPSGLPMSFANGGPTT